MSKSSIGINAVNCGIPTYMVKGLERWIELGVLPGNFLTAVLENDLMGALERSDLVNQNFLLAYGRFLFNYAPSKCYGSVEKVTAWEKMHKEKAKSQA